MLDRYLRENDDDNLDEVEEVDLEANDPEQLKNLKRGVICINTIEVREGTPPGRNWTGKLVGRHNFCITRYCSHVVSCEL